MKIFIDTANLEQIKEVNSWGILDGVTTNPTLVAKEGCDFRARIEDISKIVDGPISAEAVSMKAEGIVTKRIEKIPRKQKEKITSLLNMLILFPRSCR